MSTLFYSIAEGFRSLKISPLQTFFSILGIIIGVASLVAILALGDGMESYARGQIASTTNIQSMQLASVSRLYKNGISYRNPDFPLITYNDKKQIEALFDSTIESYYYFNHAMEIQKISDTLSIVANVSAVEPDNKKDFKWIYGEINNELIHEGTMIWVSSAILKQLKEASLDTTEIKLFGKKSSIRGVFQEDNISRIVAPISLIPDSLFQIDPPSIVFKVSKVEQVNQVKAKLYEWANTRFPNSHQHIKVNTYEGRVKQAEQAIMVFKLVMGLITGISVLVGGIGVMNVLLMSIKERTPEIGIRKALGAKRKNIVVQFLAESVTVSIVGSFAGLIFSAIFMEIAIPIIKSLTEIDFPLAWTLSTLITVCIVAIVVGITFGTYPAYKASRLVPIDAIQRV